MPHDNTTGPAIDSARAAFRAAAITFATSTAPALATALETAVLAAARARGDVVPPMLANEADADFYRHLKRYVDRLIASRDYAGPALPYR